MVCEFSLNGKKFKPQGDSSTHLSELAKIKKKNSDNTKCRQQGRKLDYSCAVGENINDSVTLENSLEVPFKMKNGLTI